MSGASQLMSERFHDHWWRVAVLSALALICTGFFMTVDWRQRFATDVSRLLPGGGPGDSAAELFQRLRQKEERLITGAVIPPEAGWTGRRDEAAAAVTGTLRESGEFRAVGVGAGMGDPDAFARRVFDARFDLLLPEWAEKAGISLKETDPDVWAAAITNSLEEFLTRPEASALADLIPSDPFPLSVALLEAETLLVTETNGESPVLFWAEQRKSPFLPEGQAPVLQALEEAAAAAADLVGARLRHTAVASFASESERRIRREITWLNAAGVAMVMLVALVFLRRRTLLPLVAVPALLSVAGGLVSVLMVFPVAHVLSLVVGALLIGVAVDYGIHVLLHRSGDENLNHLEMLREVRRPLLVSAISTAGGFAALYFADLPLLRQIGVFVAGGLLAALMGAWLVFPLVRRTAHPIRMSPPGSGLSGRWPRGLVWFLAIPALAGWLRLEWRDDLRDLQPPLDALRTEDAAVRALFSPGGPRGAWLCHGATAAEARRALAAFETSWIQAGGHGEDLFSLARWIAPAESAEATRSLFGGMAGFESAVRRELDRAGFEPDSFAPFFEDWNRWRSADNPSYEGILEDLANLLDGPPGILLRGGKEGWHFLVSVPVELIPTEWRTPPQAVPLDQLETLNNLFAQYRHSAWRLSGVAFGIIAAGVMAVCGWRAGAAALAPPVAAWLLGMGALAGLSSPLGLFHVLGGFLGFCVALDYGLFNRHSQTLGHGPPVSIRLSAATTLSVFGVLAFSSIPALSALGASVFAVVLAAWLWVEVNAAGEVGQRVS